MVKIIIIAITISILFFTSPTYRNGQTYAQVEGTCQWLPGPPIQAVSNCAPSYTPAMEGNPLAPRCVCKPPGSTGVLPTSLVQQPSPTPNPTAQPLPPPCSEWRDQAGNIIPPQTAASRNDKYCAKVKTGLGIDISTHPFEFVRSFFGILLSISGGIALLIIIYSGYKLMISRGNPETIQAARETLTSAIVGLLFIIFSMVLLQLIGVDILHIPGLQ